MKTVIVYDSLYGNTEKIAKAIGEVLGKDARVLPVQEATPAVVKAADVLVVGSPVHGGRAKPELQQFLDQLSSQELTGKKVAAFDTRMDAAVQGFGLKLLMRVIGYAAPKMEAQLLAKGGKSAAPATGFIVDGKEGPLRKGELERATVWIKSLL